MERWTLAVAAATLLAVSACSGQGGSSPPDATSTGPALPESAHIEGMFPVGDRELYLTCSGSGEPTVVLESGEGQDSGALYPIRAALDSHVHVCSYDRANVGMSDPAEVPRSAEQITADLEALLESAEVPGPYVLVGHSAGGMLVDHYARTHLEQVIGVVAMNPVPRYDWAQELMFPEMTEEERATETAYFEGQNEEGLDLAASSEQLAAASTSEVLPFNVVISSVSQCATTDDSCARTYPAYEEIMSRTAAEWGHGAITQLTDAGHDIHLDSVESVLPIIDEILTSAGYDSIL